MSIRSFFISRKAVLSMTTALSLGAVSLFFFAENDKSKEQPSKQPAKIQTQARPQTNLRQTLARNVSQQTQMAQRQKTLGIRSVKDVQRVMEKFDQITLRYARKHLPIREGRIDYLYLDSKGSLTTGIGLNVNDWKSFKLLDFKDARGRLLTESQKKAYHNQILAKKQDWKSKKRNFRKTSAEFYIGKFAYRPTPESLNQLFHQRLMDSVMTMKKMLGLQTYYNLHPYAQAEMAMMHFNMGSAKFNQNKWPSLFAAARCGDYQKMSQECHIKNDEQRSNYSKAGFFALIGHKTQRVGDWYAYLLKLQKRQTGRI